MKKEGKGYSYFVWAIATLIYLVVFFHRVSLGVVKDEVMEAFGIAGSPDAGSMFALLGAMYMYAYMFMQIPTGILADTLGPRKTISLGSLVASIGVCGFAITSNLYIACVSRFLVGAGLAVVFVCTLKLISEWFPKEKFSTLAGITSFVGNLGAICAMTPLVMLNNQIGWRNALLLIGMVTVVLAVLCFAFVRDKRTSSSTAIVKPPCKADIWKSLKVVLKDKDLYPIMIAFGLIFGSTIALTGTWGVEMVQDLYGVDKVGATQAMSLITLGVAVGSIVIGRLSDWMKSRKKPMVIFAGAHLMCWIIIAFIPLVWGLALIMFFLLGFTSTSFIVSWAYAKEKHPPEYSGMAMSAVNFVGFLGGALVPQAIGLIYDTMSKASMEAVWARVFVMLICFVAIAFVLLTRVKEEKKVPQS